MRPRWSLSISNICLDRHRGSSRLCRPLFAGLMLACLIPEAYALDPNRAIHQYIRDQWSDEQGFPGGAVNALAQTPDGYLWIGAEKGLVRFDGQNFRLFNNANMSEFPISPVLGLITDAEGSLWIRLQSPGLLRYRRGIFESIFPDTQADRGVTAMALGIHGDVLLARPGDPIR